LAAPVENRGLYALWYNADQSVLDAPFITGGQIVCQWRDVEPAKGRYDFSTIERQLKEFSRTGRKTTIQINGNRKPDWLFDEVPHTSEQLSVQVRDPQGTLMYWHPTHRDAYLAMLKQFAAFIRHCGCRDALIGMRLNFNPIGTEHLHVPDAYNNPGAWTVPDGADPGIGFTEEINLEYQDAVVRTYVDHLAPLLRVFVRNGVKREIEQRYRNLFECGKLGWFHTSSEAEPRSTGTEFRYMRFYNDCRSGKTVGFAEPWASAWGHHGGQKDHRPFSPPQWNYWRLLIDLHCGISYIGIYTSDLNVAMKGIYRTGGEVYDEADQLLGYREEFMQAFLFAAKYAGYHAAPRQSPGAWVAFRGTREIMAENVKNRKQLRLNDFTGDYSFLMAREPDSTEGVHHVGPDAQRHGAWARRLPAGDKLTVRAHPEFIDSLNRALVKVTYLDEAEKPGALFEVAFAGGHQAFRFKGSGQWETAQFTAEGKLLGTLKITGRNDLYLHMVEICRQD
jgi:hypothetical protein